MQLEKIPSTPPACDARDSPPGPRSGDVVASAA